MKAKCTRAGRGVPGQVGAEQVRGQSLVPSTPGPMCRKEEEDKRLRLPAPEHSTGRLRARERGAPCWRPGAEGLHRGPAGARSERTA